jgi:hypothetical protein
MQDSAKLKRPQRASMASRVATEQVLEKMLAIIKSNPGIRHSELNRRLHLVQSDSLRATLIRRRVVRKVKNGRETHLYAT